MEMKINISDYLSEEEIKEIIIEELKSNISSILKDEANVERIIINSAYLRLDDEISKIVPNYKEILSNKIKEIFNDRASISYQLFSDDSLYHKKGKGLLLLEETVRDNKFMLEDKIIEAIGNCKLDDKVYDKACSLVDEMSNNMYQFIDLLKNKNNE